MICTTEEQNAIYSSLPELFPDGIRKLITQFAKCKHRDCEDCGCEILFNEFHVQTPFVYCDPDVEESASKEEHLWVCMKCFARSTSNSYTTL